ncbi:alpha/beta hydrolase family protein [Variovorax ginsengisoli]|uniref:Alpha/beta hydrolase n=1 Tax=Variovorax ginsengisoli TaxID=363844 RepID=A0ABT8RYN5_9BURK|nr:alpha/beta hydrolase [Variovorax ginsengisoli]MDN8611967.1 alpha/beta hydrolase [Variovorax ginsengisoli]MDO1531137.1 alpha/beta hydrolase [Variovorax ginsengisoli]
MPNILRALAAICFSAAAATTHGAGFSFVEVPADAEAPALRGAVWYPCRAPTGQVHVGPMRIPGVEDCAMEGDHWPLVVFSHGSGGSFLGHHDTATALADAGFVVAAISHPGDNFQDLSRQGDLSVFESRPVDMRRLVDHMVGRWPARAKLAPGEIGFFGFSRGGYTGLVAIGAKPDFKVGLSLCPAVSARPICQQIRRNEQPRPPRRDARIKAAVIVDPLSFFTAEGLKQVNVPVQLWASAYGGDGVTPESVDTVRRHLPSPPDWNTPAKTVHFSYLAPCSPALAQAVPEICSDRPGFDRVAFHQSFNAKVLAFFRTQLSAAARPVQAAPPISR